MNFKTKNFILLILAIASIACSRLLFWFLNDPEGPNLFIVMVTAVVTYSLFLSIYFYFVQKKSTHSAQPIKYVDFLKTMNKCPFCANSPGRTVTENEHALMTFSLAPYHPDHLLVTPKRHVENLLDLSEVELRAIDAMQKKALEILQNIGYKNISILVREGENSGRTVPHIHYHIIPDTVLGDLNHKGENRNILSENEIQNLMKKLRSTI